MQIPSPGAVWPAIVMFPFFISSVLFNAIVPDTSNTIIRLPLFNPSRSEPEPLSFRFVT